MNTKCFLNLLSFILFVHAAIAQTAPSLNCSNDILLQQQGVWKDSRYTGKGIAAADIQKQKKVLDQITKMIKTAYHPVAVEANAHIALNPPYNNYRPVNYYDFSIIPLEYYCEGNQIKKVHETSSYFQIFINQFGKEIYDTAQGDRLLQEGFNVIYDMPIAKDGYFYFKEKEVTLPFDGKGKTSEWLITYDGQLPFSFVTKKEFLEKRKKALYVQEEQAANGFRDVLKGLDIEKGFKEKEYVNNPAQLQRYMKMEYENIKIRYNKLLQENKSRFKPAFDKIDKQLAMSPLELNQFAIVKDDPYDHLSYLFVDSNDPFRKILIKPNPTYFKKLPRSSPQFIWISVSASSTNVITAKFMSDIVKALDFKTMINLLGK